jgi:hypothetical protein
MPRRALVVVVAPLLHPLPLEHLLVEEKAEDILEVLLLVYMATGAVVVMQVHITPEVAEEVLIV